MLKIVFRPHSTVTKRPSYAGLFDKQWKKRKQTYPTGTIVIEIAIMVQRFKFNISVFTTAVFSFFPLIKL